MDVYNDSLAKLRSLMEAKGHQKVVEEFSESKDNSGVFMPDIITDDFGNEEGIEEHEVNWYCAVECV